MKILGDKFTFYDVKAKKEKQNTIYDQQAISKPQREITIMDDDDDDSDSEYDFPPFLRNRNF